MDQTVSIREVRDKSRIDCFAWQRAFSARLALHGAPTPPAQITVAYEILLTWPFDVTEWDDLH